jgi:hypothetical protein
MKIFQLFDEYLLILMLINSLVAFFIDAGLYEKKSDFKMKMYARVISVISFILAIVLYVSGQILGGI